MNLTVGSIIDQVWLGQSEEAQRLISCFLAYVFTLPEGTVIEIPTGNESVAVEVERVKDGVKIKLPEPNLETLEKLLKELASETLF